MPQTKHGIEEELPRFFSGSKAPVVWYDEHQALHVMADIAGVVMQDLNRRQFLKTGALLAAGAALGVGGLLLREDAKPTESSGAYETYAVVANPVEDTPVKPSSTPSRPTSWHPTEDNILGPFYLQGAPYRAKISPPLAEGKTLVIRGRVWGYDTRQTLSHVVLDIWHADAQGHYYNLEALDDSQRIESAAYRYRARLVTDASGYYEFETIHPGRYKLNENLWRPSHIHYLVQHPGYNPLITQLYFEGDPINKTDPFIKPSLIIPLRTDQVGSRQVAWGTFDIVLAPA